jgi:SRSO17 transposase
MSPTRRAPGGFEKRLTAYMQGLAEAVKHADRVQPLHDYCAGLLLPGERKSVEPIAARVAPEAVDRKHQSLLHFVGESSWDDEALVGAALDTVLPAMQRDGAVTAWIVDDTGTPKKGRHSVGVAHQYCGQLGKPANCQAAVTLSLATQRASIPVAHRLYLPKAWAEDYERRREAKVPEEIAFQTKTEIALDQIRRACTRELPRGTVLADAAYGTDTGFRSALAELKLRYLVGVQPRLGVWFAHEHKRQRELRPLAVKEVALALPAQAWRKVSWREGTKRTLTARFAARRVRTAHPDSRPETQWLLMEWPESDDAPTKYALSNLPASTTLRRLVETAKQRWIIERDYLELKQELGLGDYEGRGWRGFHHHATLCIVSYGFLVAERARFSPSGLPRLELRVPRLPPQLRPRGSPPPR